jgi:hypothetical protein
MLTDHFKDTVTLSRSTATGNKTTYATVGDPFACAIQPMTDKYSAPSMGRSQKTFRMFSTTEVRIGDRLVDQNDASYEVTGAVLHRFRNKSHYEAELRGV